MKSNGKILPALERFFEGCPTVPFYKTSLPWMVEEQKKHSYASSSLMYQYRANLLHEEIGSAPEIYYENKIYETIVGALLRTYLAKKNPGSVFYYTSQHDDYLSACDYIVSKPGNPDELVRIDLTVGEGRIRSFEENHSLRTISKKIHRFERVPGIPAEFFHSVKPHTLPQELPLIIVRMSRSIISEFAYDFFRAMELRKSRMDILEFFTSWIHTSPIVTKERIAYILGMDKTPAPKTSEPDDLAKLAMQIGSLFAGVRSVYVSEK